MNCSTVTPNYSNTHVRCTDGHTAIIVVPLVTLLSDQNVIASIFHALPFKAAGYSQQIGSGPCLAWLLPAPYPCISWVTAHRKHPRPRRSATYGSLGADLRPGRVRSSTSRPPYGIKFNFLAAAFAQTNSQASLISNKYAARRPKAQNEQMLRNIARELPHSPAYHSNTMYCIWKRVNVQNETVSKVTQTMAAGRQGSRNEARQVTAC